MPSQEPAKRRHAEIIEAARQQPTLTNRQIAEALSVSESTVHRALSPLRKQREDVEAKLAEYASQFEVKLPIQARVDRYVSLAQQDDHPIVALKALERIDSLDGIRITRESEPAAQQAPAFVLPPGCNVAMMVRPVDED